MFCLTGARVGFPGPPSQFLATRHAGGTGCLRAPGTFPEETSAKHQQVSLPEMPENCQPRQLRFTAPGRSAPCAAPGAGLGRGPASHAVGRGRSATRGQLSPAEEEAGQGWRGPAVARRGGLSRACHRPLPRPVCPSAGRGEGTGLGAAGSRTRPEKRQGLFDLRRAPQTGA